MLVVMLEGGVADVLVIELFVVALARIYRNVNNYSVHFYSLFKNPIETQTHF